MAAFNFSDLSLSSSLSCFSIKAKFSSSSREGPIPSPIPSDFSSLKALKSETSGNLRMDVLVSADHQFSIVQLFQFVPYNYTPITGLYHYKEQEASAYGTFLVSATTH